MGSLRYATTSSEKLSRLLSRTLLRLWMRCVTPFWTSSNSTALASTRTQRIPLPCSSLVSASLLSSGTTSRARCARFAMDIAEHSDKFAFPNLQPTYDRDSLEELFDCNNKPTSEFLRRVRNFIGDLVYRHFRRI